MASFQCRNLANRTEHSTEINTNLSMPFTLAKIAGKQIKCGTCLALSFALTHSYSRWFLFLFVWSVLMLCMNMNYRWIVNLKWIGIIRFLFVCVVYTVNCACLVKCGISLNISSWMNIVLINFSCVKFNLLDSNANMCATKRETNNSQLNFGNTQLVCCFKLGQFSFPVHKSICVTDCGPLIWTHFCSSLLWCQINK